MFYLKPLFLIYCLLGVYPLVGQNLYLTDKQEEDLYFRAYDYAGINYDTIQALYQGHLETGDSIKLMHAASWLSVTALLYGGEEAAPMADLALSLSRQQGLSPVDQRLSPAYVTKAFLHPDYEGDLALRDSAYYAAPAGSFYKFYVYMQKGMALNNKCDDRIEGVFIAMDTLLQTYTRPDKEKVRLSEYGGLQADYYRRCKGAYEKAAIHLERKMNFHEQSLDNPDIVSAWAESVADLAYLNTQMGRIPIAEALMQKLDTIDFRTYFLDIYSYTNLNTSVFNSLLAIGQQQRAKERLLEQLSFSLDHQAPYVPEVFSSIYESLYQVSMHFNEFEAAIDYLLELKKHESTFSLSRNHDMAVAYYELGDYQTTIDTALQALRKACLDCDGGLPKINNELRPSRFTDVNISALYRLVKRSRYLLQKERGLSKAGLADIFEYNTDILSFSMREYENQSVYEEGHYGNSKELVKFFNENAVINAKAAKAIGQDKYNAAVFTALESGKANDLKRSLESTAIPMDLIEQEEALAGKLRQLEVNIATSKGDSVAIHQADFLDQAAAYRGLWQTVQEEYGVQLGSMFTSRNASLSDLQQELKDGEVFLHYLTPTVLSPDVILIQLITRDRVITRMVPFGFDLEATINSYRQLIRSPLQQQNRRRQQFIALSHQLFELLIAPVKADIPTGARLMICPNDALFFVPFETLVSTKEDQPYTELDFLIKTHPINYHYSATAYLKSRQRPVQKEGLFAFAPVFDGGIPLGEPSRATRSIPRGLLDGLETGGIDPLPATREEVEGIAAFYPPQTTEVRKEYQATKSSLQEGLNANWRIIHVATHGILNTENNDLSALACHDPKEQTVAFLYSNEIKNQDIKADLIILSSCDSGLGRKVIGDGLISLNRALFFAGARNVVSTLWKIDDRFSSSIMIDFHRQVASGDSYTNALRAAKIAFLTNPVTAGPRYWAPFVLLGE